MCPRQSLELPERIEHQSHTLSSATAKRGLKLVFDQSRTKRRLLVDH